MFSLLLALSLSQSASAPPQSTKCLIPANAITVAQALQELVLTTDRIRLIESQIINGELRVTPDDLYLAFSTPEKNQQVIYLATNLLALHQLATQSSDPWATKFAWEQIATNIYFLSRALTTQRGAPSSIASLDADLQKSAQIQQRIQRALAGCATTPTPSPRK